MSTLRNLMKGASTIMVIFPNSEKVSRKLYKPNSSDYDALRSDWERVGYDLKNILNNGKKSVETHHGQKI